jgi:hypothetical protein
MSENRSDIEIAFDSVVSKLAEDMPLIQHGSGDVPPQSVRPDTAQLLATLTARYISNLVDAALDAQLLFCDNSSGGAAQPCVRLPPPEFPLRRRDRAPSRSRPAEVLPPHAPSLSPSAAVPPTIGAKRRRRADDEFWDEPLVPPRIKKEKEEENPAVPRPEAAPAVNDSSKSNSGIDGGGDEWVGVAGADFFLGSDRTARGAYVRCRPGVLTAHNFLFCVCHDVYAYHRVVEIMASKRAVAALLVDPVLADMVRTEGRRPARTWKNKTAKKKAQQHGSTTAEIDDMDDEDVADEEETDEIDGPVWPGLEQILPVHRRSYGSLFRALDRPESA